MFPYPYEPNDVGPLDPTLTGVVFLILMVIMCTAAGFAIWAGYHEKHKHHPGGQN